MEEKINIAAILKDKSQGTKLYDWLHNIDIELDTISTTDTETVVWCTNETNNNTTCHRGYSEFGTERGYPDGLQILFPSKEMRDWRKFLWKKGDVLVCIDGKCKVIFDKFDDDKYTSFIGKHYIESYGKDGEQQDYEEIHCGSTVKYTKESEEAAQTYINTIEERLGGKLNLETLEIEKQHEKKEVVDLNPKWTPKPFDRVITRNAYDDIWTANIFSHMNSCGEYVTIGCASGYHYCLPYNDETAHLLGTTDEWKGGEG